MKNPLCDMLVWVINELVIITTHKKSYSPKQRKYVYNSTRNWKIKEEMAKKALGFLLCGE